MKHFILFLSIGLLGLNCYSQKFNLQLKGISTIETKVLDSLHYSKSHNNLKSTSDEIVLTTAKLSKIGYLENKIIENKKLNDSTYIAKLSLGKRIKFVHIYIGRKKNTPNINQELKKEISKTEIDYENSIIEQVISLDKSKDTLLLPFEQTESFLNQTLQKLEQKGFALAKLKLIHIKNQKQNLYAELDVNLNQQRKLNSIVVKFDNTNKKNSFPEGHLHQMNRKYTSRVFNQKVIQNIHDDFNQFQFINQIKYPELLLTKDTTKVFVYVEKRNANTFDGFIGFTTNEKNKLTVNGYIDLQLQNTLKIGEQFSLYWKSDGKDQKTFKASLEIPYLFNTPLGLKTQIQIFKQDSIFQNTKTSIDLGYLIDYRTRIYLGYHATESSDIQKTNSSTISDYNNSFINSNFEFLKFDTSNTIFTTKSKISLTIGYGDRTISTATTNNEINKQIYIDFNAMNNFYLNNKNCINLNFHNYYLKSDSYIINELYRFGGTNTIRGFEENSLQANFMSILASEYRYILSPDLYIHTIFDYAHYQDKTTQTTDNLIGLGIGFGIQTKNGLLKIAFTNGISKNRNLNSSNTIVSVNYNVKF